mmetsp:Transcript_13529/g.22218  ORF Transcript_13529/g.22218 Transcript_13529/m.22218 type:complete len:624 (-) Transcript_13529:372-2243(-)|eukprot:CAMPEP_0184672140 /NCGR_PEP_ID=MMETSP0308-20130426/85920_1 /TAXON_ID=38269 /ORGANISM="Gloeochaete witrockiana, Strain SAG 46.84" /LENGTH=623 /DNA_ID=CAMNT_0027119403 /DNA_START=45 /DNA_END=1916 /DNA_ORIENTATION=-
MLRSFAKEQMEDLTLETSDLMGDVHIPINDSLASEKFKTLEVLSRLNRQLSMLLRGSQKQPDSPKDGKPAEPSPRSEKSEPVEKLASESSSSVEPSTSRDVEPAVVEARKPPPLWIPVASASSFEHTSRAEVAVSSDQANISETRHAPSPPPIDVPFSDPPAQPLVLERYPTDSAPHTPPRPTPATPALIPATPDVLLLPFLNSPRPNAPGTPALAPSTPDVRPINVNGIQCSPELFAKSKVAFGRRPSAGSFKRFSSSMTTTPKRSPNATPRKSPAESPNNGSGTPNNKSPQASTPSSPSELSKPERKTRLDFSRMSSEESQQAKRPPVMLSARQLKEAVDRLASAPSKKITEQELERHRQIIEIQQMAELTFQPKLSDRSKELAQRARDHHIDMAGLAKGAASRSEKTIEKVEQMRKEKEEAEMKALRPVPQINERSKQLVQNHDRRLQWEEERTRKIELMRIQQEEKEQAELTFHPRIDPKSDQIAQQHRESVEDRLWRDYEIRQRHQVERENEKGDFHPQINARSQSLQRDGPYWERLHSLARSNSGGEQHEPSRADRASRTATPDWLRGGEGHSKDAVSPLNQPDDETWLSPTGPNPTNHDDFITVIEYDEKYADLFK